MPINSMLAELDAEIERLEQARLLLSSLDGVVKESHAPAKETAKRKLNAAARRRISAAQRKRWALTKGAAELTPVKAAKESVPQSNPETEAAVPVKNRGMSAAARKRIAVAQKKRWAAIKAAKKVVKAAPAKKVVKKVRAKKAPVKKPGPAKRSELKKLSMAKGKKVVPEKAGPFRTEAAPF